MAFSGGKDSIVLLELVKRALPRSAFMVIFGDTGMEFPDTYEAVKKVEERCKEDGIAFYTARSRFKPEESWKLFGPPSRKLSWCCTVHKSTPQILKLREIVGKRNYVGMSFVGVRGHESVNRSQYNFLEYGKKLKGQYSCNPLIEWTSAQIWIYMFWRELIINAAYKKGCARVGCLFCPKGSGNKSDYVQNNNYQRELKVFTDLILANVQGADMEWYLSNGGWVARCNGRDIKDNAARVVKESIDGKCVFHVCGLTQDLLEWKKTIADQFESEVVEKADGFDLIINEEMLKSSQAKLISQCVKKSAYCVGCGACEANCTKGALSFDSGLHIDGCIHCGQCHSIPAGCFRADSLKVIENEGVKMKTVNTFSNHAPKPEWISDYMNQGVGFIKGNNLGPIQQTKFKRFLKDANLLRDDETTVFFDIVKSMGLSSLDSWGLMYSQLVINNPQIQWYVKNLTLDHVYLREEAVDLLVSQGQTSENASQVIASAFKRICDLGIGTRLNFGHVNEKGRILVSITRTKPVLPSERVFLYGLYRFAEACGGYYEFNLSRLLDFTVESEGVSPAEIFAMTREETEQILNGLANNYREFITFTQTHDLELIKLADDKKSDDILNLFK